MNPAPDINIREVAFSAILSMILFSAAIFLPPMGILFSIFCPIPIVLIYLYRGQKVGMISMAVVTVILIIFVNMRFSMIFFIEYGLVAIVMAESIRRRYSIEKIVLCCVGVSMMAGGLFVYLFILTNDMDLGSLIIDRIDQSIILSTNFYREMGFSGSEIDEIQLYSEKLVSVFLSSFPAWMVVSLSMGVFFNYVLIKIIWKKYIGNNYFENENLEKWSANENTIWLLIGSGVMLFIPMKGIHIIGLNLLIVFLLIYFFQGLSIVLFFMRKKTIPFILKVIAYILIIIQPLLLLFIIPLGLFDMWADFRKLKEISSNHDALV